MEINSFVYTHKVNKKDIDTLQHVNNVVYVKWVQIAAEKHWQKISTTEVNTKYVWVVLRHEIDYISAAFLNDILEIKTWIGNSYGVKSERFVTIKIDDKVLVNAKTIWCLLDKKTMKPVRITAEIFKILENEKEV